jgi:hypothetical protein
MDEKLKEKLYLMVARKIGVSCSTGLSFRQWAYQRGYKATQEEVEKGLLEPLRKIGCTVIEHGERKTRDKVWLLAPTGRGRIFYFGLPKETAEKILVFGCFP